VRSTRQAAGFNQRQLADRAGVSLAAIRDLEQGRTRRPRLLRLADRIAVVGAGRIPEIGIHDELSRAGGAYAKLMERQRRSLSFLYDGVPGQSSVVNI
jgi:transcriptional regulator with XRE-family HTH domain